METYKIKVYKIWYDDCPDDFYIGSTKCKTIAQRMVKHRYSSKYNNSLIYKTMREKGAYNCRYVQIAEYDVSSKDEQMMKEQLHIDELKPCLNMHRSHGRDWEAVKISKKEADKVYYQENKEKIAKRGKEYREQNKEKIKEQRKEYRENKLDKEKMKEYNKQYRENNKEKIKEKEKQYNENNKEKRKEFHKKYRENNKEKLKEKNKKYYQDNKEKILEKQKEKFTCECGSVVSLNNFNRHLKTKKHKDLMNV